MQTLTIAELPEYIRRAEKLLSAAERLDIVNYLASHPKAGDLMPLYMLTLFAKNEHANISKAERNELAELVELLVQTWLESRKENVWHAHSIASSKA